MEDQTKSMKTVYTVIERGPGKSFWVRIGVGFTNKDGSLNLRLDAIPVNGTLQVREWEPYDRRPEASDAQGAPGSRSATPQSGSQPGRPPRPRDNSTDSLV
ncbi:MAG: hypothetical protein ACLP1X_32250 [Polyangiaceae bacterium]|jgi:hypothetical protein